MSNSLIPRFSQKDQNLGMKLEVWTTCYAHIVNISIPDLLSNIYRIVPGKRPWALAARAPKGWAVTRRRCLNRVQLSPCKGPPRMRSLLPGCTGTASSLRPCFVETRGQPDSGESCIVQSKRTLTKNLKNLRVRITIEKLHF